MKSEKKTVNSNYFNDYQFWVISTAKVVSYHLRTTFFSKHQSARAFWVIFKLKMPHSTTIYKNSILKLKHEPSIKTDMNNPSLEQSTTEIKTEDVESTEK